MKVIVADLLVISIQIHGAQSVEVQTRSNSITPRHGEILLPAVVLFEPFAPPRGISFSSQPFATVLVCFSLSNAPASAKSCEIMDTRLLLTLLISHFVAYALGDRWRQG